MQKEIRRQYQVLGAEVNSLGRLLEMCGIPAMSTTYHLRESLAESYTKTMLRQHHADNIKELLHEAVEDIGTYRKYLGIEDNRR